MFQKCRQEGDATKFASPVTERPAGRGAGTAPAPAQPRKPVNPFRYFNELPEVMRLVVMMHVRFQMSLWNVGITGAIKISL